jgi:hypothetical protein
VSVRPLALLDAAVEAGPTGAALLRALGTRVGLPELEAVVEHAVGRGAAARLIADVSCNPPTHRPEWETDRNRYSEL